VTPPDTPRWVEAHGIASDPAHWRVEIGGGYVLGHDAMKLISVVEADPDEVRAGYPSYTLLLQAPHPAARRALLHTLDGELPDFEGAIPLPADAPIPAALEAELRWTRNTIWTCYVDGEPVCFAYAPWRSPSWFDVSVDTLPGYRQLGLGTIVAAAMIRAEQQLGRQPVWGADEENYASLRLAARLGFVATDELWVCAP
jgi:GNAT superfamily N-acetyltransferase